MKPHIHFHSDCPFFAGCENMLVNFFQSPVLNQTYEVSFSYRYSANYELGFNKRVQKKVKTIPLQLPDVVEVTNMFSFKPLKILLKFLFYLLFIKYWIILWNTSVLYRVFKKEKINILHINNGGYPGAYTCMAAVFAARLCGISNIIYVVNNIAFPYSGVSRLQDYPLDKLLSRSVKKFVTGSAFAGRELAQVLDLPLEKVANIHNGIIPRVVTEERHQVLSRLNISTDRLLLGVVAILEKRKGHIHLLEAMQQLKNENFGPLPLVLIEGNGPEKEKLLASTASMGLELDVLFIVEETNVFNFMNAVDVMVLPSIANEDFPNVILEAMSLGKPVIASRIAGVPEQIVSGETGIIVEPGQASELAEAIKIFALDRAYVQRAGQAASGLFNQAFTAETSVSNYLELYQSLLKEEKE